VSTAKDEHSPGKKRLVRVAILLAIQIFCVLQMIDYGTFNYPDFNPHDWRIHSGAVLFFLLSFVYMLRELWLYFRERHGNRIDNGLSPSDYQS
jgi:hypothetical protein